MGHAIVAEGLVKRYGNHVALDGLDLHVDEGTVLGVLGPNGAGKTTTVRILSTLLPFDGGRATVCGYDVRQDADALRGAIGLSGQYAAVDESLTGRENLDMVGRLYHLPREEARDRADELLEQFSLTDAGRRPVRTYSGGMRRRLDLAASIVARPKVLFLDEPTTGLDPRSRNELWEVIRSLVAEGTTLLLTTQYLDEADALADRIAVIDHGNVIAEGTAEELKTRVGGAHIVVTIRDRADLLRAARALCNRGGEYTIDEAARRVTVPATREDTLVEALRVLDGVGVAVDDIGTKRPSLDDVFLALTGRAAKALSNEIDATQEFRAIRVGRSRLGPTRRESRLSAPPERRWR